MDCRRKKEENYYCFFLKKNKNDDEDECVFCVGKFFLVYLENNREKQSMRKRMEVIWLIFIIF